MELHNKTMEELEAMRSALLRQLQRIGPVADGTFTEMPRRCGTASCRCHRGHPHKAWILAKKVDGKSVTIHVPRDLVGQVRQWNDEHKRVKSLLKQVAQINDQIIRSYVRTKRQRRHNPNLSIVERTDRA